MASKSARAIGATVVLAGVAVAALLQGGSGDPESIEIANPDISLPPVTAAPLSTSAPAPFEYRVGLLAAPSTDNFWAYVGAEPNVWNAYVLGPTKPALYTLDPEESTLVSEAAVGGPPAEPEFRAGTWVVDLELGTELAWSDGTPVTAEDVEFTFDTVRRLQLGGGWAEAFPAVVQDVTALSPTSLRINFGSEPGLDAWPYGVGLAPIMPAHAWAPATSALTTADALYALSGAEDVSGGPLTLVEMGELSISAIANPGHPGSDMDRVTYSIFPDEAAAVAALNSGELDTILTPQGLSAESVAALGSNNEVEVTESPANSIRYLGFNLQRQPMADAGFRQALALLLDRAQVAGDVAPGSDPAYTLVSPANRAWYDATAAAQIASGFEATIEARLTDAMSALEAEGYAWTQAPKVDEGKVVAGEGLTIDGQAPAPLTILTPGDEYDPARPLYASTIESALETLGFDVRPVVTDFDTVVDLAFTPGEDGALHYDMYLLGWTLGNPSLPGYYRWFFGPDNPSNTTGYESEDFAASLNAYEKATDQAKARAALWEMEKVLARDLPYLVLYHPEIAEAYRSDRVRYGLDSVLGGIQGRLGGLTDLEPVG